jgi:centrosomal protein CEP104
MDEKLLFKIVHVTGSDSGYPESELNEHTSQTKGWQSTRFCEYPQEVGIEVLCDNFGCSISQVQILSHQSKIASKVELFLGNGTDYHEAEYFRMGNLFLDSNEKSGFRARELKSVYLNENKNLRFIRLLIHSCHINKHNLFNQVGIVAINIMGTMNESLDGNGPLPRHQMPEKILNGLEENRGLTDESMDPVIDEDVCIKLSSLSDAKQKAVEVENYSQAKELKSIEVDVRDLGITIAKLNEEKSVVVSSENYDRAAEIKEEVDTLRNRVELLCSRGLNRSEVSPAVPSKEYHEMDTQTSRPVSRTLCIHADEKGTPPHAQISLEPKLDSAYFEEASLVNRQDDYYSETVDKFDSSVEEKHDDSMETQKVLSTAKSSADSDLQQETESELDDLEEKGEISENYIEADAPAQRVISGDLYDDDIEDEKTRNHNSARDEDTEYLIPSDPAHDIFPGDEHPLAGVPNYRTLPAPDDQVPQGLESLERVIGNYRQRCLLSKNWSLREAALLKLKLMLQEGEFTVNGDISANFSHFVDVVLRCIGDRTEKIVIESFDFLECLLAESSRGNLSRSYLKDFIEPIIPKSLEKLNDGSSRIRSASAKSLLTIAKSAIGLGPVAKDVATPLPLDKRNLWRALAGRLSLLKELVLVHGASSSDSNNRVNSDVCMNFATKMGAFAHSHHEVREGAKFLAVVLHDQVGLAPLEKYLSTLRPKQLEEYHLAFDTGLKGLGLESHVAVLSVNNVC